MLSRLGVLEARRIAPSLYRRVEARDEARYIHEIEMADLGYVIPSLGLIARLKGLLGLEDFLPF